MTLGRHLHHPGAMFASVRCSWPRVWREDNPISAWALASAAAGVVGWRGAGSAVLFPYGFLVVSIPGTAGTGMGAGRMGVWQPSSKFRYPPCPALPLRLSPRGKEANRRADSPRAGNYSPGLHWQEGCAVNFPAGRKERGWSGGEGRVITQQVGKQRRALGFPSSCSQPPHTHTLLLPKITLSPSLSPFPWVGTPETGGGRGLQCWGRCWMLPCLCFPNFATIPLGRVLRGRGKTLHPVFPRAGRGDTPWLPGAALLTAGMAPNPQPRAMGASGETLLWWGVGQAAPGFPPPLRVPAPLPCPL